MLLDNGECVNCQPDETETFTSKRLLGDLDRVETAMKHKRLTMKPKRLTARLVSCNSDSECTQGETCDNRFVH